MVRTLDNKITLSCLCDNILLKIQDYIVPNSYCSGRDAFRTLSTLSVLSKVCKFLNRICKYGIIMRLGITQRAREYQKIRAVFSHEVVFKNDVMKKLPWVKKTSMFFDLPSTKAVEKHGPWYFATRCYDRTDVANWCVRYRESSSNKKRKMQSK
jgi:hypothetical protein